MNEKEFQNENEFQNFLIAQTFHLIGHILIPDYVTFIQEKQSDFFFYYYYFCLFVFGCCIFVVVIVFKWESSLSVCLFIVYHFCMQIFNSHVSLTSSDLKLSASIGWSVQTPVTRFSDDSNNSNEMKMKIFSFSI